MPRVSIIVPCFNEEKTIFQLLEAIYAQDFPRDQIEVLIADGLSEDGTRAQIAAFQKAHPQLALQVLGNSTRRIPTGLNLAIAASRGEIILRLDAHCVPHREYVSRSVQALEAGLGWNVGGVWQIQPGAPGWVAASIAEAAAHPLGVGDAFYRFTAKARAVDTVPFGAFRRALLDRIGPFDEGLLANEDYEFNARIRQAGGAVWLNPEIRSVYYSRPSLGSLARQYARYGYWKWQMLKRYPGTLRWRQALPPLFVLALVLLPLAAQWWPSLIGLWCLQVVSYVLVLTGAGLQKAASKRNPWLFFGIPLAIATMHLAWGSAFLWSLFSTGLRRPEMH